DAVTFTDPARYALHRGRSESLRNVGVLTRCATASRLEEMIQPRHLQDRDVIVMHQGRFDRRQVFTGRHLQVERTAHRTYRNVDLSERSCRLVTQDESEPRAGALRRETVSLNI